MPKYYHYYDKVYEEGGEETSFNDSLVEFFKTDILKIIPTYGVSILNALEIGCGTKSILESLNPGYEIDAIDVSANAVKRAKERGGVANYFQSDICLPEIDKKYDFIFDAHTLHCLAHGKDLEFALMNIYSLLNEGGIFAFESMITHKTLAVSRDFFYDGQEKTLYKVVSDGEYEGIETTDGVHFLPYRKIMPAMELEQLVLKCGFEIIFFYAFHNKKIIPDPGRTFPTDGDPDLLRVICRKK